MYLSNLDDPFEMIALLAVAGKLSQLVVDSEKEWSEGVYEWGAAPKYRSAQEDHHIEVTALLLGSTFVLGQAAITQTVSSVTRLRDRIGKPSWLPRRKREVLIVVPAIHEETGLSKIVLIDAVANYFKHYPEWAPGWRLDEARKSQRRTIEVVTQLGLSPKTYFADNLIRAARNLGFEITDMSELGACIQAWREELAENLRRRLQEHNL